MVRSMSDGCVVLLPLMFMPLAIEVLVFAAGALFAVGFIMFFRIEIRYVRKEN